MLLCDDNHEEICFEDHVDCPACDLLQQLADAEEEKEELEGLRERAEEADDLQRQLDESEARVEELETELSEGAKSLDALKTKMDEAYVAFMKQQETKGA